MHAVIECRACGNKLTLESEPRLLVALTCPACRATAHPQAAEDFSSAIEDALVQMWRLRQTHNLQLHLDTDTIPAAFCPATAVD